MGVLWDYLIKMRTDEIPQSTSQCHEIILQRPISLGFISWLRFNWSANLADDAYGQ